ncbi:MAG TPA: hypothetical protein VMC83_32340 [Streptosporangiaceae bacterium]|nr:hypothetical protein [Streptosporangiaceae bacterium]
MPGALLATSGIMSGVFAIASRANWGPASSRSPCSRGSPPVRPLRGHRCSRCAPSPRATSRAPTSPSCKQDEDIDPGWFSQLDTDVLCVVAGQLRVEFKAEPSTTLTLRQGDVLVLPPDTACRAYRWPRDSEQAAVFLAVTARPGRMGQAAGDGCAVPLPESRAAADWPVAGTAAVIRQALAAASRGRPSVRAPGRAAVWLTPISAAER